MVSPISSVQPGLGAGPFIDDDGTCAEEYDLSGHGPDQYPCRIAWHKEEVPLIDADEDDVEVGYYLWVWLVPALFVLAAVLTLAQKCGWIH